MIDLKCHSFIPRRSRFVQGLLLSTLSLDDEHDTDQAKPERIAPEPNLETGGGGDTLDVPTNDSTASRQQTNDFNESKKKQESASHSDIPQHLSSESNLGDQKR